MSDNLKLSMIPDLPPELENAAKDGRLVLFVGAGASMLVGMPSWEGLASAALDELVSMRAINYAEKHALSELNAKTKLSIADQIARDLGGRLNFTTQLVSNGASKVYDAINSIGAVCVTTNYDHELAPIYKRTVESDETLPTTRRISGVDKLNSIDLKEPGTVIHLHGDKDDPRTMIVTTREYLAHYDTKKVMHFLHELFKNYVVLFLGYGLQEAEILEHILRRAGAREETNQRRRFTLQPFMSKQQPLYEKLVSYYEKSFGVHLIGYNIDAKGYLQLEDVMRDWGERLSVRPLLLADELAELDEVIADE